MVNTILITAYLTAARVAEAGATRLVRVVRSRDERGQASAEYALVLLGAALLAIFFGNWLMKNDTLQKIFGDIISKILGDMPR